MSDLVDHFDAAAELLAKLADSPEQQGPEVTAQAAQAHALLALVEAFEAASVHLAEPLDEQDDDEPQLDSPWIDA